MANWRRPNLVDHRWLKARPTGLLLVGLASFIVARAGAGGWLGHIALPTPAEEVDGGAHSVRVVSKEPVVADSADVIVFFVGSHNCSFAQRRHQQAAVQAVRAAVHQEAGDRELRALFVGIAVDDSAEHGLWYLNTFNEFDEMIAGSAWRTTDAGRLLNDLLPRSVATPQFVILERVRATSDDVESRQVGRALLRYRAVGTHEISRWIAHGARIPSAVGG